MGVSHESEGDRWMHLGRCAEDLAFASVVVVVAFVRKIINRNKLELIIIVSGASVLFDKLINCNIALLFA